MNRICVYTCITGNYDNIKEINQKEKGIDYYCFTNNRDLQSSTWNVVYIDNEEELSNTILARKIKILGHSIINDNYDVLLWMDGSVEFNTSIKKFINHYLDKEDNFVAFKHGERKNIKEECYACVRTRKESKDKVSKLLNFYQQENYEFNNGLIESTVYMKRPKDKKVQDTMKIWFDMIKNYSKRDQLSFNYAIHKTGLKVKWINEKVFDNEWFKCQSHNYEKKISSYRVYFCDKNNDNYNLENDIQGEFSIDGNKFSLNIVVPCDTEKTVVEISRVPFIEMNNLEVNKLKNIDIHYFNAIVNDKKVFFYNENPAFEIYNKLNKGQKLTINMDLRVLSTQFLIDMFKYEEDKYIKEIGNSLRNSKQHEKIINKLQEENNDLRNELNKIVNSKSWKFIRYFDKYRKRRKK